MEQHKVVIIGAGVSGCAAAKDLIKAGIEDLIILEATDRIGGRVRTLELNEPGAPQECVEMGAQWVHGDEGNPLYAELAPLGLIDYRGEYLKEGTKLLDKQQIYKPGGERLPTSLICETVEISDELDDRITELWSPEDVDIHQFKQQHLKEIFQEYNLTDGKIQQHMNILKWLDNVGQAIEGCTVYDRSHLIQDDHYDECGGKNYVFPKGTYSWVETILLPTVEHRIKLNTEVTAINWCWSGGSKVKVTTNEMTYLADHVIVTPSIGFLKENHKQLFMPPLPEDKCKAIDNLPFAKVEKSILYYDEPFWPASENDAFEGYYFVPGEDDDQLDLEMSSILGREAKWWKAVCGMSPVKTNLNILIVWLAGDNSAEANTYSDEAFTQAIQALMKHYAGIRMPSPARLIRTNWANDKYFCGSYSCPSQTFRIEDCTTMMTPLCNSSSAPSLLFAGEAYHTSLMSSMPGAYQTGKQQAQVIIDHLTN